ncbi:hypothetical protein BR93DRAFT_966554 [Coniochaeta sp. PMI_546]|nr:hypothetical protein BR93DRAFT_966554 [Coniochaeta sp. PMI_546]
MAVNPNIRMRAHYGIRKVDYLVGPFVVTGLPNVVDGGNTYSVKVRVRTKHSDQARDAVKACLCVVNVYPGTSEFTGQDYAFPYPAPIKSFGAYQPKSISKWVLEFKIPIVETPTEAGLYNYEFRLYENDRQSLQIGLNMHQVNLRVEVVP